jgi:hypothetical protein
VFVFFAEIKRLAEKEDWIVDNEGLTSLVSFNSPLIVISAYYMQSK